MIKYAFSDDWLDQLSCWEREDLSKAVTTSTGPLRPGEYDFTTIRASIQPTIETLREAGKSRGIRVVQYYPYGYVWIKGNQSGTQQKKEEDAWKAALNQVGGMSL